MGTLAGRRIVVTRERRAGADTVRLIRQLGGVAVQVPLIEIVPSADLDRLDSHLLGINHFDWLLFSSRNAVAVTLERCRTLNLTPDHFSPVKIAAVGTGTADALAQGGLEVDLLPPRFRWQELAEAMTQRVAAGARILFPHGNLAKPHLVEALRKSHLLVEPVVVYETKWASTAPDGLCRLSHDGGAHAILLTSDSAVESLAAALSQLQKSDLSFLKPRGHGIGRPLVAYIGPNTAAVARKVGLPIDVVAPVARVESLVSAVATALSD